ncbi:hypothetical protein HZS_4267 [Henneguya salminicola]|nr:hypothetical protein HZS_4267 [Henneguya salminicola]
MTCGLPIEENKNINTYIRRYTQKCRNITRMAEKNRYDPGIKLSPFTEYLYRIRYSDYVLNKMLTDIKNDHL